MCSLIISENCLIQYMQLFLEILNIHGIESIFNLWPPGKFCAVATFAGNERGQYPIRWSVQVAVLLEDYISLSCDVVYYSVDFSIKSLVSKCTRQY